MNLLRRRSRVVRGLAALSCVGMATAALATVPAAPAQAAQARAGARAALAAPAVRAALARAGAAARAAVVTAPAPPTNPGGDLVVTASDGGLSDATVTQVMTIILPESVGLSPDPTLSSLLNALYDHLVRPPGEPTVGAPPVFTGGTYTVSGGVIKIDVPASAIPPVEPLVPGPLAGLISAFCGFFAAIVGGATAAAFIGIATRGAQIDPNGKLAAVVTAFAFMSWGVTGWALADKFTSTPLTGSEWAKIGLYTAITGAISTSWPYLSPFLYTYMPKLFPGIVNLIVSMYQSLSAWIGAVALVIDLLRGAAAQETPQALAQIFATNGFATPGSAGTVTDSALSGGPFCMDGGYGHAQPLAIEDAVAINGCNGNANQNWQVWSNGNVTDDGLCLTVEGDPTFSLPLPLDLNFCDGSSNQVWRQGTNLWGQPLIRNPLPRLYDDCVDDTNFNTTAGTKMQAQICNHLGDSAQEWLLPGNTAATVSPPTVTNVGTVTSGFSGKCMDAYGASNGVANGQIVAINDCNGNPNQNWSTWTNGMITNGGLCLEVEGDSTAVGALVDLLQCDLSGGQVWKQQGNALVNPQSGLCLDDPFSNTSNGTQLRIWSCNGTAAQQWILPGNSGTAQGPPPPNGTSEGGTGTAESGAPCDIYGGSGTPCVAAYSTVRALYSGFGGPLYQVKRASDGATANIGLLSAGGYVNAAAQDSFCAATTCTITEIYDQSPKGNNLTIEGPSNWASSYQGVNAAAAPITISGHPAYGVYITQGTGYRNDHTTGIAVNGQPEGMYMVTSGTHYNGGGPNVGCCFDFGNVETSNTDTGNGHMDALNFSSTCFFAPCSGSGPWVQADLENGLFQGGNGSNTANKGNSSPFVTALLANNGQTTYELEGGNSDSGGLSTWYNGPLPNSGGYSPMHQEGAIVLGTGGDGFNQAVGTFFEGVMTAGFPSQAADNTVQANIVSAGYSGNSGNATSESGSGGSPIPGPFGLCLDGSNAAQVVLNTCNGSAGQQWRYPDGQLETEGLCLDNNGAPLVSSGDTWAVMNPCNGSASQQWVQGTTGAGSVYSKGQVAGTSPCLDDWGGVTSPGARVQIWYCYGVSQPAGFGPGVESHQKFVIPGHVPGPFGMCLDGSNAAQVVLNPCGGAAGQQWTYTNGSLETLGLCLDNNGAPLVSSGDTWAVMNPCNGNASQQWVQGNTGAMSLYSKGQIAGTSPCLDDWGGVSSAGARVQVWYCYGVAQPAGYGPGVESHQTFNITGLGGGGPNATQGPALAGNPIPGPFGLCLDGSNAAQVVLNTCNGSAGQQWRYPNGQLETEGLCLDNNGAPLVSSGDTWAVMNPCNGSASQQWVQGTTGAGSLYSKGQIAGTSPCLDDWGGVTSPGARVQVWYCYGVSVPSGYGPGVASHQKFVIPGQVPGPFGMCLDGSNTAQVVLNSCNGAAGQQWTYTNGSLETDGLCLDNNGAPLVSSGDTWAVMNPCNGNASQQWVQGTTGAGSLYSKGQIAGTSPCLDDWGGVSSAGARVQVWYCYGVSVPSGFGPGVQSHQTFNITNLGGSTATYPPT